jgi:hypothetical protein
VRQANVPNEAKCGSADSSILDLLMMPLSAEIPYRGRGAHPKGFSASGFDRGPIIFLAKKEEIYCV